MNAEDERIIIERIQELRIEKDLLNKSINNLSHDNCLDLTDYMNKKRVFKKKIKQIETHLDLAEYLLRGGYLN